MSEPADTEVPEGIEASWDLDGLDVQLQGPGMSMREMVLTSVALVGLLELVLIAMALGNAWMDGSFGSSQMWGMIVIGLGIIPACIIPMVGMGGLLARGKPLDFRIEPGRAITMSWIEEPVTVQASEVASVEVPEEAPPRVVVHRRDGGNVVWRVRNGEHARWLAAQLEGAVDLHAQRLEGQDAVPESLVGIRNQQRE